MREREVVVLSQLLKSLEEAMPKLEKSYNEKDLIKFTNSKRFILQIQRKINECLK